MRLLTVCHREGLPGALVLERTFRAHHPDADVEVLVTDEAGTLGIDVFEPLASMYGGDELARALVPFALEVALARSDEPVVALAPDARVLAPLEPVAAALTRAAAVLVPRRMMRGDVPAGEPVFDEGFVGLADERGRELVRWWAERVLREGLDGSWLDRLPALSAEIEILRDPGCAVAAWNLSERDLVRNGELLASGQPIRWARLAGVDPERPHLLPGILLSSEPLARELVEAHVADLKIAEAGDGARPDPFAATADGIPLDARLRALYAQAFRQGDLHRGVFDPAGAAAFRSWLTEPDPAGDAGGVSRYLYSIYRERSDVRQAYPNLRDPEHRDGFNGWTIVHGTEDLGIPRELLPPEPPGLYPSPEGTPMTRPWGVNVAGYFQSELGVGEAARKVIEALDAVHVPLLPVQGSLVPPSRRQHDYGSVGVGGAPFPINLICVNADGLPDFARHVGEQFFAGRFSIGVWWWEVESFPTEYHGAFDHLHQVWVGSDHVLEGLAPVSPIPVVKVRLPVTVAPAPSLPRSALGLPDGFVFLFLFDYHSVFERKNPLGLIEAFSRAFPPGSGASLVVKCINAHDDVANHERLLLAANRHADVHVFDRYVTAAERDAMLASCDCYASLHRAEGFGLTLAEAMYLGKPVVATGYSGNLDYMTSDTGWLVPWERVRIGEGNAPYPADGTWAEPDLDSAAASLREVFEDRNAALERGRHAATVIRQTHSPAAAGALLQRRLDGIRPRVAERVREGDATIAATARAAAAEVRQRVASRPEHAVGGGSGGRRLARRALLRVLRPLSAHQRWVDEGIVATLERLAIASARRDEQAQAEELALYAAALARARRLDARTAELQARVERALPSGEANLTRRDQELAGLLAGVRALPYMAGDPFEIFPHPVAGQVLGYRRNPLEADGEEKDYRRFEDIFRGPRTRVAGLVAPYVELLRDAAPVLDFGCGRGEMLEALRAAGIEARGVDSDAGMAVEAQELGLDVTVGDGIAYLEALPDDSLGGLFAAQVIEHLPHDPLRAFFRLGAAKLRSGGVLIAETVNPHAVHALKTFWVDPTHRHPLFPEVVLALCANAGFESAFVCHLAGVRDVEQDRFQESSYAVVASV